jgi:hypothetical protein
MSSETESSDAEATVLDAMEITQYEVPVDVVLKEYDEFETLEADIRATAANTILGHVDEFWCDGDDAHEHVRSRVEFDTENVQAEFELGDADGLEIQTVTKLGMATEGEA